MKCDLFKIYFATCNASSYKKIHVQMYFSLENFQQRRWPISQNLKRSEKLLWTIKWGIKDFVWYFICKNMFVIGFFCSEVQTHRNKKTSEWYSCKSFIFKRIYMTSTFKTSIHLLFIATIWAISKEVGPLYSPDNRQMHGHY